jgi:hypothetical protein
MEVAISPIQVALETSVVRRKNGLHTGDSGSHLVPPRVQRSLTSGFGFQNHLCPLDPHERDVLYVDGTDSEAVGNVEVSDPFGKVAGGSEESVDGMLVGSDDPFFSSSEGRTASAIAPSIAAST